MSAPTTLLPFDVCDTLSVSQALFERIVEATNSVGLRNKWFLSSEKKDVMREIVEAGERAAKSFARDRGVIPLARVIAGVTPISSRVLPSAVEEIQFRVHLNGVAYERLVADICGQR